MEGEDLRYFTIILLTLMFVSGCGGGGGTTPSRNSSSIGTFPNGSPGSGGAAVPSIVSGLSSIYSSTAQTITITWNATPNADTYEVRLGGGLIGTPTSPTYTFSGAASNTTYTFSINGVSTTVGAGPAASTTVNTTANTTTITGTLSHQITGASVSIYGGISGLITSTTSLTGGFTLNVTAPNSGITTESLYIVTSGGTGTGILAATAPEYRGIIGNIDYANPASFTAVINEASTVLYAQAASKAGGYIVGNTAQDTAMKAAYDQATIDAGTASGNAELIAMTTLYVDSLISTNGTAFTASTPTQFALGVLTFGNARLGGSGILPVVSLDTQASSLASGFNPSVSLTSAFVNTLTASNPALSFAGVSQARLSNLRATNANIISSLATAPTAPSPTNTTSAGAITMTWNPSATATSYDMYLNGVVNSNVTTGPFTFTALTNGVTYSVGITAKNSVGASTLASATATPSAVPAAPLGLTTVFDAATNSINVTWTNNATVSSYNVYNGLTLLANVTTPSFTISNVVTGTTYSISVAGVNASGEGAKSLSTITPVVLPAAPTGLVATAQTNGNVFVVWNPYNGSTSFTVKVDFGLSILTTTTNSLTLTGLTTGVPHTVTVTATVGGVASAEATTNITITSPTAQQLPAPATLTVTTLNATTLHLTWSPVTGAASYQVKVNNGTATIALGIFQDISPVTPGSPVLLTVAPVDAQGNVGAVGSASGTLVPAITTAPINLVDTNVVVGSADASLSWSVTDPNGLSTNNGGFIKLILDGGAPVILGNTATTFGFVALSAATHTFQVFQCNDAGCGAGAALAEVLPH